MVGLDVDDIVRVGEQLLLLKQVDEMIVVLNFGLEQANIWRIGVLSKKSDLVQLKDSILFNAVAFLHCSPSPILLSKLKIILIKTLFPNCQILITRKYPFCHLML